MRMPVLDERNLKMILLSALQLLNNPTKQRIERHCPTLLFTVITLFRLHQKREVDDVLLTVPRYTAQAIVPI